MATSTLKRILLVDDELFFRSVVQTTLETLGGFVVMACSSGQEALEVAPDFAPDLILLDVMMPGMDGPTTFQQLRQVASLANVPIAFLTAQTSREERVLFKQLGAVDVIAKPFEPQTLPEKVQAVWECAQTIERDIENRMEPA